MLSVATTEIKCKESKLTLRLVIRMKNLFSYIRLQNIN